MTIRGEGDAHVAGGTSGIVVRAPHVVVQGMHFTGYALNDSSGRTGAVVLDAPAAVIRENTFDGNAFAITAARADGAVIANNVIRNGDDGIRLWYTPNAIITGNTLSNGRDVLISYSSGVSFERNTVQTSRYGLHNMFSDRMRVRNNRFENNEVGANFMYAKRLDVSGNTFVKNHHGAGYGIGFEDIDDSRVQNNRFLENRVASNFVDSPSDAQQPDTIDGNLYAQNGSALALQSDPHALRFWNNSFADNLEDVEVSGGGTVAGAIWTQDGRGNYWSAYPGYDRNGDGIGDISYEPRQAFDMLTDTHPELQMFRFSPAALAVQFAARALPASAAQPKFVDAAPLMASPTDAVAGSTTERKPNALAALLALLASAPLVAIRCAPAPHASGRNRTRAAKEHGDVAIEAVHVRKLYARERGVRDVSLTVRAGESVALWGANGAGKSTFFRCILGGPLDAGSIRVFGRVPTPHESASRHLIGYAPQYLPDFDARVGEIAEMIATLRGTSAIEVQRVLALLHLSGERERYVSELSGGMRQRLSLALALIGDPPLLLLDEPTAGLDRESRETVTAVLNAERKRGTTLLLTSHLASDVLALADRVVTLENGLVVENDAIGLSESV